MSSTPAHLSPSVLRAQPRVLVAVAPTGVGGETARLLCRSAVEAVVVADGLDALSALRGDTFDAVVLDAGLGLVDGQDVYRWIRDHGPDRSLPVLLVGAVPAPDADGGEATDVVAGPVTARLLRARVVELLRRRGALRADAVRAGLGHSGAVAPRRGVGGTAGFPSARCSPPCWQPVSA